MFLISSVVIGLVLTMLHSVVGLEKVFGIVFEDLETNEAHVKERKR